MAEENKARAAIRPADSNILVRVVFLYVGQGSSAVVFTSNLGEYDVSLVDINYDRSAGGIDVPRMMKDLLAGGDLFAFMNTHPHDDHLQGIEDLANAVNIKNVYHSGHIPSKEYGANYDDLQRVIKKVEKVGGSAYVLEGSNTPLTFGDANCHVLAPADHVTDDVNEDDAEARYRRIHEQCAVLKFGKADTWIMIPGDADRCAFEIHIADYHDKNLASFALAASHHGSRTFFRENEDDEPYTKALERIAPKYVIISAPKKKESRHGHPHDDAVVLYSDQVGEENIFHTGKDRFCFIFDIYKDGTFGAPQDDAGVLAKEYKLTDDDGGGDGGNRNEGDASKGGFTAPSHQGFPGGRRFA